MRRFMILSGMPCKNSRADERSSIRDGRAVIYQVGCGFFYSEKKSEEKREIYHLLT
jgi:hypothetical protein